MPAGAKRARKKTQYNVHEAKSQFSRLLVRTEKGETITIARGKPPVAQLTPLPQPRRLSTAKGQIWFAPDYDDADAEIAELFNNGPVFPEP